MKWLKIRKGFIAGNAIRISKGLGWSLPLLLSAPVALATLDLTPAADSDVFQMRDGRNWDVGFRDTIADRNVDRIVHTRVPDSTPFAIARKPEIFRQMPLRRAQPVNLSPGTPNNDPPVVPEPPTIIAASLLLIPFGATVLRIMRKRQTPLDQTSIKTS